MSVPFPDSREWLECFAVVGVLHKMEGHYLFDPCQGEAGPVFQIPEDSVVSYFETGRAVSYADGKRRRLCRVFVRRSSTALRLEYVQLQEALRFGRPAVEDSSVILVPPEEVMDGLCPAFVSDFTQPSCETDDR
jgi:hypothetical protein